MHKHSDNQSLLVRHLAASLLVLGTVSCNPVTTEHGVVAPKFYEVGDFLLSDDINVGDQVIVSGFLLHGTDGWYISSSLNDKHAGRKQTEYVWLNIPDDKTDNFHRCLEEEVSVFGDVTGIREINPTLIATQENVRLLETAECLQGAQ